MGKAGQRPFWPKKTFEIQVSYKNGSPDRYTTSIFDVKVSLERSLHREDPLEVLDKVYFDAF